MVTLTFSHSDLPIVRDAIQTQHGYCNMGLDNPYIAEMQVVLAALLKQIDEQEQA